MEERKDNKLEEIEEMEEDEEELVDIEEETNILKTFLAPDKKEISQEEEINNFEYKKDKDEIKEEKDLSEEELRKKRKKEEEEEEELKRVKKELINSLERVKLIVKRIYGNVGIRTKSELTNNKLEVQRTKNGKSGGKTITQRETEEQERGFERGRER